MFKIINYFFQAILIYFFFFIALLLRIKISRTIFSNLFSLIGPIFKSKKILNNNLQIFSQNISKVEREIIISNM